MYTGNDKNLNNRIKSNHLSADQVMATSLHKTVIPAPAVMSLLVLSIKLLMSAIGPCNMEDELLVFPSILTE
jgi:hypothetical protein